MQKRLMYFLSGGVVGLLLGLVVRQVFGWGTVQLAMAIIIGADLGLLLGHFTGRLKPPEEMDNPITLGLSNKNNSTEHHKGAGVSV